MDSRFSIRGDPQSQPFSSQVVETLKTFISTLSNLQYIWDHVSIFALHTIPLPPTLTLVHILFGSGDWMPRALKTLNIKALQLGSDCLEESEGTIEAKYWPKKVSSLMKGLHNVDKLFLGLPGLRFVPEGGHPAAVGLEDPLCGMECAVGSIEIALPFCWPGARPWRSYHWVSPASLLCAESVCSSFAISCWFSGGLSWLASNHPTKVQIDFVQTTLDTRTPSRASNHSSQYSRIIRSRRPGVWPPNALGSTFHAKRITAITPR